MSRRVTVRLGGAPGGRVPPISTRIDLRVVAVLAVVAVVTLAAFVVGVGYGDFPIAPSDVLATLVGRGSAEQEFIVLTLRLPRVLVALLCGAALALSGALFQNLTRNGLVAPDVIGINAGASLVAVAVIVLRFPSGLVAPGALVGGLVAAVLLYTLSYRNGLSSYRLVLVGIALNAAFYAGVSYLLTRGDIWEVQRATVWMIGSLSAADWPDVRLLALTILVIAPVTFVMGRQIDALQLGDDVATAAGVRVERVRLTTIGLAVVLASIAVSVVGPIGFVAFIAPHIARRLAATNSVAVLPVAMIVGGLLVLASDIVAQHAFSTPLPVGIVTTFLGAPYFLYLLQRANRLGHAT